MPHLYSRSPASAVRHATYRAYNRYAAPKHWQRLRLQQDTPTELSFLQTNSGLAILAQGAPAQGLGAILAWLPRARRAMGLRALEVGTPHSGPGLERALNLTPATPLSRELASFPSGRNRAHHHGQGDSKPRAVRAPRARGSTRQCS